MMRNELAERIRAANPVPPTVDKRQGELTRRHALALLAVTAVVVFGVAAAFATFVPRYFGSSDSQPVPETVLAQLHSLTPEERAVEGGLGQVDPDRLIRLASFETERGLATIYAAPASTGSGFCEVHTTNDLVGGGVCHDHKSWEALPRVVSWDSEWGDVTLLMGPLGATVARIDVRFEDGSVRAAATRSAWWVYLVGGAELEPGHRPIELIALDRNGGRIASGRLDPGYLGRP
jgi:hypothetical protein